MLVTLRWLRQYVDIEESGEQIADMLTHQGLEVSDCTSIRPRLEGVSTGRVVSVEPHGERESLWVCRLDAGGEERVVLCGAQNVREGDVVPLASPGARLPSGRVIEAVTLHGVYSEGMLCSERELDLSDDHEGILILPADTPVGRPLTDAVTLDDDVLEIEVTPNRPDCLSVIGVAREIAAKQDRPLRLPRVALSEEGPPAEEVSAVEILAPDACPRYVARVLEGVRIGRSPFWLRRLLGLVGQRPINNIVDVTNFVMLEWGQPLHAFDLERLAEHRIVVRKARAGERIVTLDGQDRTLTEEDLLICDAREPVALAGVMGGRDSEISAGTTRILLESAFFAPKGIRRTSKRLGLSTEASYRFEREIDPEGARRAADRACGLMLSVAGGSLRSGALDAYPGPYRPRTIRVTAERINRLLGTELDREDMIRILESLEMSCTREEGDALSVVPPAFRPDVQRRADLAEEVARLHGYDAIPTRLPRAPLSVVRLDPERRAEERARDVLVGLGFREVVNYSFADRSRVKGFGFPASDSRNEPLPLQNPLNEAQGFLRTTLIGSLLDTLARNLRQRNRDLRLFELRKVFLPAGDVLPLERKMLAGVMTGRRYPMQWDQPGDPLDLYDLKGVLEVLCRAFRMDAVEWKPSGNISCLHPGCSGDILINTTEIGYAGKLHPIVRQSLEIEEEVFLFELGFDSFMSHVDRQASYRPFSRQPPVERDIALVLDESLPCGQVTERMRSFADSNVRRIDLFDVYQGPPVPEGKKSMAFRLTYQAPDRSLTDDEVNELQEAFLKELLPALQAQLR